MTLSASSLALADARGREQHWELAQRIVVEFRRLPGRKGLKILAPASDDARGFEVAIRPQDALFVASAFKGFVLAEYLRQVEAGEATLDEQLDLDESVWSLSSPGAQSARARRQGRGVDGPIGDDLAQRQHCDGHGAQARRRRPRAGVHRVDWAAQRADPNQHEAVLRLRRRFSAVGNHHLGRARRGPCERSVSDQPDH